MNSPELDQQFYAALGGMELGPGGIRDYDDVTDATRGLQEALIDHVVALDSFHDDDEAAARSLFYLKNLVEQDFARLRSLDYGDEIIASGSAIVVAISHDGKIAVELLSDTVRLHGTILEPSILEVPFVDTGLLEQANAIDILEQEPPTQLSAVLEIENGSIEVVSSEEGDSLFDHIDTDLRVFLALAYPDLKVKRRV